MGALFGLKFKGTFSIYKNDMWFSPEDYLDLFLLNLCEMFSDPEVARWIAEDLLLSSVSRTFSLFDYESKQSAPALPEAAILEALSGSDQNYRLAHFSESFFLHSTLLNRPEECFIQETLRNSWQLSMKNLGESILDPGKDIIIPFQRNLVTGLHHLFLDEDTEDWMLAQYLLGEEVALPQKRRYIVAHAS